MTNSSYKGFRLTKSMVKRLALYQALPHYTATLDSITFEAPTLAALKSKINDYYHQQEAADASLTAEFQERINQ